MYTEYTYTAALPVEAQYLAVEEGIDADFEAVLLLDVRGEAHLVFALGCLDLAQEVLVVDERLEALELVEVRNPLQGKCAMG
jgi:hypothetical protein